MREEINHEWKISEVNELFDNEHFQARLEKGVREAIFTKPLKMATAILAAFGITSIAAGAGFLVSIASQVEKTRTEANALRQQITDSANTARLAAASAQNSALEASTVTNGLNSSATMASAALNANQRALEASQNSLTRHVETVESQVRGLTESANDLKDKQKDINESQKSIREAQRDVLDMQAQLQNDLTKVNEAEKAVELLKQNAKDLASFKTFEFVTLRSRSIVNLNLRNIEPLSKSGQNQESLVPVNYKLTFTTHGIARPFNLTVALHREQQEQPPLLYKDIELSKKVENRPYYCICGTPFMFQVDNYVQEPFVHDFVTLKVVGWPEGVRPGDLCQPPAEPQECPRPRRAPANAVATANK